VPKFTGPLLQVRWASKNHHWLSHHLQTLVFELNQVNQGSAGMPDFSGRRPAQRKLVAVPNGGQRLRSA
jgi:hypothetical protein